MKESTKIIAKVIVDQQKCLVPAKNSADMIAAMLDYINASKSGMPTLIMELNRRVG